MILAKIVAGLLALVWDVESAFVGVTISNATIVSRGMDNTTCTAGSASVTITHCGQTLTDGLVNLIISGTALLGQLVSALNVGTVTRAS